MLDMFSSKRGNFRCKNADSESRRAGSSLGSASDFLNQLGNVRPDFN